MSGDKETPTLIPFGPFEADLYSQELRKQGVRLRLPRQSFQILKMLLERPGELVTREELRQALWPSDTFVDFEHGLNAAINRLRETLGDDADNPRYIETLPRRGYRFISATAPKVATAPDAIQPNISQPGLRRWSLPLVAVAVIGIAALLFALDAGGLRSKLLFRSAEQPQIRSLAVLPLTNLSGDSRQEYFADAMTEELISELSRISSLKVISQTSTMLYKGEKKKPLPQIGRELHVDAVLEGSVLRSGNRVRIAAHMIDAMTDRSLMTEAYESDLDDILKLQREVAEAITQKVKLKLTAGEKARLHNAPEVNPEAYQAYLEATYLDWSLLQENEKAQRYLEKAIQEDPGFAQAYGALAATYALLGEQRFRSPRDAYPPAKQAIRKALELDEENCRAHSWLGRISWRYDWDWQTAEREFLYEVELCPNAVKSHWDHALYLAWNRRDSEALAEIAKCREVDPLRSEPLWIEAAMYYQLRNYKVLTEVSRSFTASRPNVWFAHYWFGVGYEGSGQTLKAIPEYQKAIELSQGDEDPTAALAHAYAVTGKKAEAQRILHDLQSRAEINYISPYMVATIYASLGNKDKALEYLERAYQERSSDLPYFLRADLRIDNLRSDPRFQDLLRRMNFPK